MEKDTKSNRERNTRGRQMLDHMEEWYGVEMAHSMDLRSLRSQMNAKSFWLFQTVN